MEDKYKTHDLFHHVQEEMVAITTGVTDEDVARGKVQLKYNILQQMDGTSPSAEEIGRQMITFGRRMNLAETFARIDAIDAATIKDTVYQIVHDNDHVLSAAGPIWELPDYNYIRRRSYWLTR